MKRLVLFALLAFTITGLLTPSVISDSFADSETAPGRGQGEKTANGCYKDNNSNQAKNNPNCSGTTNTSQFTACDVDPEDGSISAQELLDYANAAGGSYTLDHVMNNWMTVDVDGNGIDTRSELRNLNNIIGDLGFTCS